MKFIEKLTRARIENNSLVCIGLDPDPSLMPEKIGVLAFCRDIIDATSDLVCAYKPNLAFFEALGNDGLSILNTVVRHIPDHVPVIGDGKRGDIGNTAKAYARALFDNMGFDAVTVSPYLGYDSLETFIEYRDRGVFVLCRTSNAGGADFQSVPCQYNGQVLPLYRLVARRVSEWNKYGNLGLVVGATCPEELKVIRQEHPHMTLLIPGVGAQGGELESVVRYGTDSNGTNALINSSRQIIYASRGSDFAEASQKAALALRDSINRLMAGHG